MNKSESERFRVILIVTIIGIILTSIGLYLEYSYFCPDMTHEESNYPLPEGKSLHIVIVRNEGHMSADDVKIYVKARGQIENVIGQMGLITGEMEEGRFFDDVVSLRHRNSFFRGELPYLPNGMVYRVCLVVEHKNDKSPARILITHREGISVERKQSCFKSFLIGLGLGVCSILVIILLYSLLKKKTFL